MKFKILITNLILLFFIVVCNSIYGAASISVKSEGYVGDVITVTATVSNVAAWDIKLTASGNVTFVSGETKSADATSNAENGSKSISAKYKLNAKGSASFKLTGDTTTANKVNSNVNVVRNISIKEKQIIEPPKPKPENKPISKSSNNYLKSMYVNVDGLNPRFSSTRMNYSLVVNENVNNIIVNAKVSDPKAKFYVSGNKNLKVGENKINIIVTAENGYKRTYTINVTKTNNPINTNAFLDNLVVEGYNLNPLFTFDNFEYNLGNIEKIDKLNILVYPKIEGVKIDILNNENFKIGENVVTIKVTSKDSSISKEYLIKFNKLEEKEKIPEEVDIYNNNVDIYNEENKYVNVNNKFKDFLGYNGIKIALLFVCIVELIEIIYLYRKVNKYETSNGNINEESNLNRRRNK